MLPNLKSITGNAAALAGNPGLIDAIQAKLDTIVGLPSGFIEEMPVEVGFFPSKSCFSCHRRRGEKTNASSSPC
jgi:hypothetical protein